VLYGSVVFIVVVPDFVVSPSCWLVAAFTPLLCFINPKEYAAELTVTIERSFLFRDCFNFLPHSKLYDKEVLSANAFTGDQLPSWHTANLIISKLGN
jgi:hypothetical protein